MFYKNFKREIGTAWYGRHVVIITCNSITNQFIRIHTSLHAPTEPPNPNCAETISQFISIGYKIAAVVPISNIEVQYTLIK
ncbi:hypothetical protein [Fredinandcohnia quinoae]|uniref:Uncharacterized protein n=1 Tax=Fredinandcohnia quinoae TaxID=2918902 RepID=A0AAW5E370_9BACI|nr:hypothetical protein [Fredinandcohnia sp. SECRCQ15]MCH1627362.1 hypothetical protein [Fredinandcohnia sp. SECRCQ15]